MAHIKIYFAIIIAIVAIVAVSIFFMPIIQVVQENTYTTWFPDGRVQTKRQRVAIWISPLQYIIQGGRIYYETKTLDDLRQILEKRTLRFLNINLHGDPIYLHF